MAPRKKKKSTIDIILTFLSVLLIIALLLRFDAVAKVVDPTGKMGLQNLANDVFPILLGATLVVIGLGAIASVWVSAALILIGVVTIVGKAVSIYNRNGAGSPDITPQ